MFNFKCCAILQKLQEDEHSQFFSTGFLTKISFNFLFLTAQNKIRQNLLQNKILLV